MFMNEDPSEFIREYQEQLQKERQEKINENIVRINEFFTECESKNISVCLDNINHTNSSGVTAEREDLLIKYFQQIELDKEGLVSWNYLKEKGSLHPTQAGFVKFENCYVMASKYFRRNYSSEDSYLPNFIELFWSMNDPEIDAYISLDTDILRIDSAVSSYMERDVWFGAPFKISISEISDGIAKLVPTPGLDEFMYSWFFNDVEDVDIAWSTKDKIKTFQCYEFKSDKVTVNIGNVTYHPVRYIHAEYDCEKMCFRHFDGAIQLYTVEEYIDRAGSDFNYNKKNDNQIKAMSMKLFKLNGSISVDIWVEYCCHFFSGNPLVYEYYSGEYPEHVKEAIERFKEAHNK